MYAISPDLKEFIESGVACLVGTGDAHGRPHVINGWGPRVGADSGTVEVFLDTLRAGTTLANLAENPRIAVTLAHPVSYRSVQLKGLFRATRDAQPEDGAWVQRQRDGFLRRRR